MAQKIFITGTQLFVTQTGQADYQLTAADVRYQDNNDNSVLLSDRMDLYPSLSLDVANITDANDVAYNITTLTDFLNTETGKSNAATGVTTVGVTQLKDEFKTILDLGDVSGTVNIDWSLAIKFKMNLTGNVTFTFSNFTAYEEVKIQALEIKSNSNTNVITWATGQIAADFDSAPIDFDLTTTRNFVSIRNLDSTTPVFESSNKVILV